MVLIQVAGFIALAAAQPRLQSTRFVPTSRPGVEQADPFRSFSTVGELIADSPVLNLGTTSTGTWATPSSSTWATEWTGFEQPATFPAPDPFAGFDWSTYQAPVVLPAPDPFAGFDWSTYQAPVVLPAPVLWAGQTGFAGFAANSFDFGNPATCCKEVTAECFACQDGVSVAEYCVKYSFMPGCEVSVPSAPFADFVWPSAVSVCSEVMCMMFCEAGFEQDANGCDICSCKEPEPAHNCMSREVWSAEKSAWCCETTGFGCQVEEPVEEPAHNCMSREVWSAEKSAWCCENTGFGCQAEEPSAVQVEEEPVEEEPVEETGCCFSFGYGAMMVPCCFNSEESVAEANCATSQRMGGKKSWVAGECPADAAAAAALTDSEEEEQPEAMQFNCMSRERFTNEKAAWCCSNQKVGCLYAVLTPAQPKAVEVDDPASDETCANGILSAGDEVCCPAACGTCGGTNCGLRPGGASSCCRETILRTEKLCSKANAPCVMTAEDDEQDPMDVVQAGSRHSIVG